LSRRNTEGGPSEQRVREAVLRGREFLNHFEETV